MQSKCLQCGDEKDKIQTPFLKSMVSFEQFVAFVKAVKSTEWSWILQLLKEYGSEGLMEMCSNVRRFTVDQKEASIMFSTVHSAKGLEFDVVLLGEDFPLLVGAALPNNVRKSIPAGEGLELDSFETVNGDGCILDGNGKFLCKIRPAGEALQVFSEAEFLQELNALYVACTRAKQKLRLNTTCTDLFSLTHALQFLTSATVDSKECDYCQNNFDAVQKMFVIEQMCSQHFPKELKLCKNCARLAVDKSALEFVQGFIT